jgi:hypothetical protein
LIFLPYDLSEGRKCSHFWGIYASNIRLPAVIWKADRVGLFILRIFFVWKQSCFMLAMWAAYKHRYMPEAVRRAECVALSWGEEPFTAFAKVLML